MVKKTLLLQITLTAEDEAGVIRKIRALCKSLGRSWKIRVDTFRWLDEPPTPAKADASTPPYRGV